MRVLSRRSDRLQVVRVAGCVDSEGDRCGMRSSVGHVAQFASELVDDGLHIHAEELMER